MSPARSVRLRERLRRRQLDALPEALVNELMFCERVLVEAVRDGRPFRLTIVA